MEMSLRQYYGWMACVIGSSDGEIEMEMADTCRRLGVPATEFRGRLLAIDILEVDACAAGGGVRKTLALKLDSPAAMQTLSFDLHDRLTQSLLRKLAMIDPNEDLEIRLWIPNDQPCSIKDREDERFVSVIQGRYCWDSYVGEPWVPRPGEELDDLERNLDYAVRCVEDALHGCTLQWHVQLAEELAKIVRNATRPGRRGDDANGIASRFGTNVRAIDTASLDPFGIDSH